MQGARYCTQVNLMSAKDTKYSVLDTNATYYVLDAKTKSDLLIYIRYDT